MWTIFNWQGRSSCTPVFDEYCELVASCASINEIPRAPSLWKMRRDYGESDSAPSGGFSHTPPLALM